MNAANDAGNIPCPNCNKTFRACVDRPVQPPAYSQLRMMKVVVLKTDGQHTREYHARDTKEPHEEW